MTPRFGRRDDAASRERTAADREAARLERERRRAEREGRPLPPEPPSAPEPDLEPLPPVPDLEPEPLPPVPDLEPEPLPPVPEPVHVEPPPRAEPPMPAPEPSVPEFEEPSAPVWQDVPEVREPPTERFTYTPQPEPEPVYAAATPAPAPVEQPTGEEAPVGVRRVGAPSVRDLPQVAGPRDTRPAIPKKQRGLPKRTRRTTAGRVVGVLILLVVLAIGWFAYRLFQPGHGAGDAKSSVRITVPPGATASDVGDDLAKRGVVQSAFFFNLRARVEGKRGAIKAGTFALKRDMSYAAALDALTKNPAPPPVIRVTIPEGRSIREAAPLIRQSGLKGSYLKAADRNPRTIKSLKGLGVPKGTRSLEGFLFPATYELKRGSTAQQLVGQQLGAMRSNLAKVDMKAARHKNLTPYDVLIIASMIEREAQAPGDRRLISAVIYNRLKQHIPLGIDATLRYHLNNWAHPLKVSELGTDSPFNTRKHQGLPPTPIGNPGLASLQAAVRPAHVKYLYYVVKPCGNGAHAFSSTDAQFERDVAAYNRKRAQLGGKDPSHC